MLLINDVKGELARLTGRITELGGNIIRLTSLPAKDPGQQIVTLKVEDVAQETLTAGLSDVIVEIQDVREGRGWGTEGFSPYHWTLE